MQSLLLVPDQSCLHRLTTRGLPQLCCGRWCGLLRTALLGRMALRLWRLLPGVNAPTTRPGVSNALNMEAIQHVRCQRGNAYSFAADI